MRENDKLEDNKLERVVAVLHMISNYEPVIMVHEQALLVIPAFLWRLRSRTWIGTGSQVDMRGTLFVIVCVIVCLVSFVGIRSRPWIEIGCPSRYAPHFICDCMCHCLSRFARCIAQSSLDWNWRSKSTCVDVMCHCMCYLLPISFCTLACAVVLGLELAFQARSVGYKGPKQ